jgi:hypothetical protein
MTNGGAAIEAVHDMDLNVMLRHLGLGDLLDAGELYCASCGESLTWREISALAPVAGEVAVFCSRPHCVERLLALSEKKQYT